MKESKKGRFALRWPWNVVVCVILVAVLGYFIGYLWSVLLGAAFLSWQKKMSPGMPENGYCMEKVHARLAKLGWAALFLFIGACLLIYGGVMLAEGTEGWGFEEYMKEVVGLGGGALFLLVGVWTAFTSVRDAFFPEKSTLAKSIRAQLPYQGEGPGVAELFAMVDRDIEANGQWFDKIAVGKEWILGEEASYIPRIRLFFGRDEIVTRHRGNGGTQTSRILELYILDDLRRAQIHTMRSPSELEAILNCISLRAPGALLRPYREYADWNGSKSEMEWENMLREFRVRQGEQELREFQGLGREGESQNLTLHGMDGSATSRVTSDLVRKTLRECLKEGNGDFSLTAGCPLESFGRRFGALECTIYDYGEDWDDYDEYDGYDEEDDFQDAKDTEGDVEIELLLTVAPGQPGEPSQEGMLWHGTDERKAEEILLAWVRGEVPNLQGWESVRLNRKSMPDRQPGRKVPPAHLALMTVAGVFQSHNTFTLEDVQVGAEGLTDGTYQSVDLTLRGGYLWMRVQVGDKTDGRCQVFVTRADEDKLRFFKTRCTHRQAAEWLMEFAQGKFSPNWKEWKDYTRQAEKNKS